FYWFQIRRADRAQEVLVPGGRSRPAAHFSRDAWRSLIRDGNPAVLESVLPEYITAQRWFQGKGRALRSVTVGDLLPGTTPDAPHRMALVNVQYVEEAAETYVVPVMLLEGTAAQQFMDESPEGVIGEDDREHAAILVDAVYVPGFRASLLDAASGRKRIRSRIGELQGAGSVQLRRLVDKLQEPQSRLLGAEQSNTSIVFDRSVVLKVYRRLEDGLSLDVEVGEFLGEHGYEHTPAVLGSLSYSRDGSPARTLAVLQEFVPNEGDAWSLTLDAVT